MHSHLHLTSGRQRLVNRTVIQDSLYILQYNWDNWISKAKHDYKFNNKNLNIFYLITLSLIKGEVTSLEDKIKKLQKHQAFTAELVANKARLQEIQHLAEQLTPDPQVEGELRELRQVWERLETATEQRGKWNKGKM